MDSKQIEIEGMKELLKENELEIGRLRKEIKNLKEERDMHRDAAKDCGYDIKELKEENRKQKLHIEAKDKAYTALLKDYEELKVKNKNLKEKLEKQLGEMLFDVRN